MTKTEYAEYLAGPEWRATRERKIRSVAGACERCHLPRWIAEIAYDQDLNVHHISYARKGQELDGDLEALCRRCHDLEHNGHSLLKAPVAVRCTLCGGEHWDRRSETCYWCFSQYASSSRFVVMRETAELAREDMQGNLKIPTMWLSILWGMARLCKSGLGPSIHTLLKRLARAYINLGPSTDRDIEDAYAAIDMIPFSGTDPSLATFATLPDTEIIR